MGGFDSPEKNKALKTVERFYPTLNRWFEMPPMREGRAKFGCAVVDDIIYVMGGMDGGIGLKSVERQVFFILYFRVFSDFLR